ncbi:MAG: amino acid ABC transporter substrate-binding protein, partial [Pusillimonas sp.]|nr:amino acid ABC transporter substrate-binding protein [Pusillimonas sp.]
MKSASLVVAFAVFVTGMAAAQAESRLDRIQADQQITLGYRESSIPFSYLDADQKPVGYSMEICRGIVQAVKQTLKLDTLNVREVPVTSSTRIPLVANGTVDLTCGSATNNAQRQEQVSFAPTTFVTATRFAALKSSNVSGLEDLKGKTVVSTAGTSNLRWLTQVNAEQDLGLRIIPAKDHSEAFLTVNSGRAIAFFMDDILLAGLVANSRNAN